MVARAYRVSHDVALQLSHKEAALVLVALEDAVQRLHLDMQLEHPVREYRDSLEGVRDVLAEVLDR